MIGTGAAHIFAEIDAVDTNFILRLWDYAPGGKRQLITTGYLRPRTASSTGPHHRGQPLSSAHPHRAGRTREDRGVRAPALPVR